MTEATRSVLIGTAGLDVAAAIALGLTLARGGVRASAPRLRAAVLVAVIAALCQAAHFAEELATGFHRRFPALLGLEPWSPRFFVSLNVCWLAAWAAGALGLSVRRHAALFPLWFLGLAGIANGVAHPLLALRSGGYFPGLVTAPVVGVAGVLLFRRLLAITGDRPLVGRGAPPGPR
jgi:hypothetical protein